VAYKDRLVTGTAREPVGRERNLWGIRREPCDVICRGYHAGDPA
jgi:hypothetical protein